MAIGSYDYEGLIRAFLNAHCDEGTTAGGRMSFYGDRLYSYNSLLAEFRTTSSGDKMLFIDKHIYTYSTTTNKQHSRLIRMSSHPIRYWYLNEDAMFNIQDLMTELNSLLKKHSRARIRKPIYRKEILEIYHSFEPLFEEYSIDKRCKLYKEYKKLPFVLFANHITAQE